MSVNRYEVNGSSSVFEDENGSLVDYKDFAALEQRLIESERYGRQTDITIDNLEMKLAQMAAENAGLKGDVPLGAIENGRAFADRLENYQFECEGGNLNMCSDWQEFRRCFEYLSEWAMHSQTEHPATDAFLAEVREQGVEMFAQWCRGERDFTLIDEDVADAAAYEECVKRAEYFAAQIRKGVQS